MESDIAVFKVLADKKEPVRHVLVEKETELRIHPQPYTKCKMLLPQTGNDEEAATEMNFWIL